MTASSKPPDIVPVLSSGRHRNPRKGACFMEMASYLAGERWSDHPTCTHPLLSSLARLVNDALPDSERSQLLSLIPDVVGLTGDDPLIDMAIATRAAAAALPIAAASRQNALAVGLLTCERMLAQSAPRRGETLQRLISDALGAAPEAERWSRRYVSTRSVRLAERTFSRQTAPHIVSYAVQGLSAASVSDAPARLVRLLRDCIADTAALSTQPHAPSTRETAGAGAGADSVSRVRAPV